MLLKEGANYFNYESLSVAKSEPRKKIFKKNLSSLFALFSIFLLVTTILMPVTTAWADEEEEKNSKKQQEKMESVLNSGYDGNKDANGFMEAAEKGEKEWRDEKDQEIDRDTFAFLFYRMLGLNYINEVPAAYDKEGSNEGKICDPNHKHKGTLLYHNCDIPNITTEFIQDIISLIDDDGMASKGAEKHSAKVFLPEIGLPSTIVKEGVPLNLDGAPKKYTGLELFGYNFEFSTYNGEWDHIKVMTSARAMANFGLMDNIKMGGKAIVDGVVSGVKHGMKNFSDSFKKGDFIGMITAPFRAYSNAISAGVNVILDSSDLNVHNTYGWYRVNYPKTVYNARQLTQVELSTIATNTLIEYLASQRPDEAVLPDDFNSVRGAPGPYKDKIAGCIVSTWPVGDPSNKTQDLPVRSPDKEHCDGEAKKRALKDVTEASGEWGEDLFQKADTRDTWKARYSRWFDMADKYNIAVELSSEGSAKTAINSYIAEWPAAFEVAENAYLDNEQNNLFNKWKNILVSGFNTLKNWFSKEKPSRNFNAPFMRFICVDKNGKDVKTADDSFVFLYNDDGTLNDNPSCGEVRPPIQGAMFGDGYVAPDKALEDTRRSVYSFDLMDLLAKHPIFAGPKYLIETMANFNLKISSFVTRISNTFLNLSMSPILDWFGINDLIVSLIDSFRESVFMALCLLIIGVSAIVILINTMRRGSFKKGFIDIGTMVLTFIIAIMILQYPKQIVNAMDSAPAYVQSVIMASIFSAGDKSDDVLCTASNVSGNAVVGFDGKSLGFSPSEASRTLMCENWRVFALGPWVQGQWGTGYGNLEKSKMKNTNGSLVGDASVSMGNGQKVNNWAAYQLKISSSGNSTTEDPENPTGIIDPNFYRLVDLQFGPNGGAASDDRYAEAWAGGTFHRLSVTFLGTFMSIAGAITVLLYSANLIQVSVVSSLMLIGLPFVLLIGLNPTAGRGKMWKYLQSLLSLLIQRVALVTLLAIMFTLLISIANSSPNFLIVSVFTIAVCIVFIMFKKDLMKILNFGLENAMDKVKNLGSSSGSSILPARLQRKVDFTKAGIKGYAGGYLAGAVSARTINPIKMDREARKAAEANRRDFVRRQIDHEKTQKRGFNRGLKRSFTMGGLAGKNEANALTRKHKTRKEIDDITRPREIFSFANATDRERRKAMKVHKLIRKRNRLNNKLTKLNEPGKFANTPIGKFTEASRQKRKDKLIEKKRLAARKVRKHKDKLRRINRRPKSNYNGGWRPNIPPIDPPGGSDTPPIDPPGGNNTPPIDHSDDQQKKGDEQFKKWSEQFAREADAYDDQLKAEVEAQRRSLIDEADAHARNVGGYSSQEERQSESGVPAPIKTPPASELPSQFINPDGSVNQDTYEHKAYYVKEHHPEYVKDDGTVDWKKYHEDEDKSRQTVLDKESGYSDYKHQISNYDSELGHLAREEKQLEKQLRTRKIEKDPEAKAELLEKQEEIVREKAVIQEAQQTLKQNIPTRISAPSSWGEKDSSDYENLKKSISGSKDVYEKKKALKEIKENVRSQTSVANNLWQPETGTKQKLETGKNPAHTKPISTTNKDAQRFKPENGKP